MLLFLSYIVGLWFTLRTHAAVIWNSEIDEKKMQESVPALTAQQSSINAPSHRLHTQPSDLNSAMDSIRTSEIRDSQLYKRILGQSLKQVGLNPNEDFNSTIGKQKASANGATSPIPHLPPPKSSGGDSAKVDVHIPGFTEAENTHLVMEVAEIAATAAAIAARDAARNPRKVFNAARAVSQTGTNRVMSKSAISGVSHHDHADPLGVEAHTQAEGGGHDAPNWGRAKSAIILCSATILYALIAEILVDTVDVVLANVAIDEKFLGITLFALVPNTTEFLVSSV